MTPEVRIEVLCLREAALFSRRHPRYLLTALALWVHSLPRWRASRLLRAAWCLAQHVDDVLDGDRQVAGDPQEYVAALLRGMKGGGEGPPEAILAAYVWQGLDSSGRTDLLALLDLLVEDRRRMDARQAWTAGALAAHHRKTFALSLDLTLRLDGAQLRAADAPELVAALAWCSPVRDLEEDLEKGLINIPAEVLEQTRRGLSPREMLAEPAVRAWLADEHQRGSTAIVELARKLPAIRDRRSRKVVSAFHGALAAYERKYRRRHRPELTPGEARLLAGRDAAL